MIPLSLRLKRKAQIAIASLQDIVVEIVYKIDENAILHGCTAIWRCYAGNRFSEDLDFYLPKIIGFEKRFARECKKAGLNIKKIKKTANVLFAKVSLADVTIALEGNFSLNKESVLAAYERIDGSKMPVFTLSPNELVREKMQAYLSRALIRDMYDVYFLLESGAANAKEMRHELKEFLRKAQKPKDERILKSIVYSGAAPSFNKMKERLLRFCK